MGNPSDSAAVPTEGDSMDEVAPSSSGSFEKAENESMQQNPSADENEAHDSSEPSPVTPIRDRGVANESILDESSPPIMDAVDKSLPGSGAITPIPMSTDESQDGVTACPKWSDVLKSPTEGEQFSPSKELKSPGSLHGLGLSVAVDRAKKLSKCGRRCATLLYDIAAIYDSFAQSILKSSQSLQSPMGGTPLGGLANACSKSLISFAKQMQGLAICVRGSVARPLHGSMTSLGETAPSVYNRYSTTRVKSFGARNRALSARGKYAKAVREAEAAIRDLKQAKQKENDQNSNATATTDTPSEGPDVSFSSKGWEKSLRNLGQKHGVSGAADQVIRVLNEVQALEAQYCKLVDEENHAVSQSQTMEVMALETVQELEEERLHFFVETIKRILQAEQGALDKIILSAVEDEADSNLDVSKEEKRGSGNVFSSFLKTAALQFDEGDDEGVGLMEADTLGLPEEVGSLRDEVKSCFAARASRAQSGKVLVDFFEEVSSACSALSAGIAMRLGQEGYGGKKKSSSPNGSLSVALEKNEGTLVLGFWNSLMMTFLDSAEDARSLSDALKLARRQALDDIALSADKGLKSAADADDQRWKYLCDAARAENKAQSRYRQTSDHFEKARDRAKSVEDAKKTSEREVSTPARKNSDLTKGMNKAMANMFSILPNGGEHAMKIMTPNARRKLAQTSLEEANEKEVKDKHALDAAVSVRALAIKNYTDSAKRTVDTFKRDDEVGWATLRSNLESSVSSFQEFRQNRYDSLSPPAQFVDETGSSAIVQDMAEWTERAKRHVAKKAKQSGQGGGASGRSGSLIKRIQSGDFDETAELGFSLQVQLEDSKSVYKLLAFVGSEGEEPDLQDENDADEGTEDKQEIKTPTKKVVERSSEPMSPSTRELLSLSETLKERVDSEKSEAIALKPRVQPVPEASKASAASKADTEVFLTHFWSDRNEGEEPPTVIESFSCAYWPKEGEGYISPLLHGRMFATSSAMYFVGWGGKKIVLEWKDVTSVKKEKNMMGTIDNALRVNYNSESGESSYFFGSFAFRENAFELVKRLSTIAKSLNEMVPKAEGSEEGKENLPPVPPDAVMKKMENLLSKKIKHVSVQKFYEIVWSEGNGTEYKPFYGPFCEYMGSRKVKVTDWEHSADGAEGFLNTWDGERYPQRRVVNFEFTRTTHLYVGPPVAQVKQTHYCRVEGNDKVVCAMTVEMSGIPYADCFAVEVRWVARREGARDLHVQVGVFVNFRKSTMFAKKIKSGTIVETKPVHEKLFEAAKKACAEAAGEEVEEEEPEEEVEKEAAEVVKGFELSVEGLMGKVTSVVQNPAEMDAATAVVLAVLAFLLLRFVVSLMGFRSGGSSVPMEEIELLGRQMDELHVEMRIIHQTLEEILSLMKESS